MSDRRLVDPIVGYRAFTVRNGGRLYSQFSGVEWPSFSDVTFQARCEARRYFGTMPTPDQSSEHEAPHPDCECGIHGYYDVGSVADTTVPWEGGEAIVGLIAGWGVVIPHPDGFRCSRARICALAGTSAEAHAAAVNCEVRLVERRSELADLVRLFGRSMPERFIPPPESSVHLTTRFEDHTVKMAP